MTDTISWVATGATVIAASMTAANLGPRITGLGFVVFTVGAICWIAVGVATQQPALLWTNVVLTILDLFGIWRWLGRQTSVEEGGRAAAVRSEHTPGEALYPISLLTRAQVIGDGTDLGRCIDAMAGCRSGKVRYIVVSEGGVAGVGETLRRLPWDLATVEGETVTTTVGAGGFGKLEILQRDKWPGR